MDDVRSGRDEILLRTDFACASLDDQIVRRRDSRGMGVCRSSPRLDIPVFRCIVDDELNGFLVPSELRSRSASCSASIIRQG